MVSRAEMGVAAVAALLVVAAVAARARLVPMPHTGRYDEATLKKISQAAHALPLDNVLHQAMEDHENERDNLRSFP
jgi:hypothetical protein